MLLAETALTVLLHKCTQYSPEYHKLHERIFKRSGIDI